jgi:hypothetical protein
MVMVFRAQDAGSGLYSGDYFTFQIEPATQSARFGRCSNYVTTTLCERSDLSLISNRWYNMKVRCWGDTAICYLDDVPLFNATGIDMATGGAGLASWHMNADFDNFSVVGMSLTEGSGTQSGLKSGQRGAFVVRFSRGLQFTLHERALVTVKYYTVDGRCVASLVNALQGPGEHFIPHPTGLAAGNYIVSLKAGKQKINTVVLIAR